MKRTLVILFTLSCLYACSEANDSAQSENQAFVVDNTPPDWTSFIDHRRGNLPLIIVAPHGGDQRPDWIDDRSCANATIVQDQYTRAIALRIEEALMARGYRPYLVATTMHRIKVDLNRSMANSFCSDNSTNALWTLFHNQINQYRQEIEQTHGRGLLIDLHGHGHPIQKIELGYLRNGSDLRAFAQQPESTTATMVSVRNAVVEHPQGNSLSDLLIGPQALGSLLSAQGFLAIPAEGDIAPNEGDAFFSGGYITQVYGSREGGRIDAIQLELNRQGLRDTNENRTAFANAMAEILLDYLSYHYSDVFTRE